MLENWQLNQPVSLFADDGETEHEYRLTFKTLSAFDEAKFKARRAKIGAILDEEFGDIADRTDEQKADAGALLDIMYRHAMIMAALAKVELRDGDEWKPSRLPDSWYDAKLFAYNAPASILDALVEAVIDAGNPWRIFSFLPMSDDEKKMLRLTVRPSNS